MAAWPDPAPEPPDETWDDPDRTARLRLARQKRRASLLLLGTGGVMAAGYALGHGFWAALLQAGGRAGLVGGLADWFAVTALFRHPLGLPIPHTAILPMQRERLGRALGGFVATHVLTADDLDRALARLDLPSLLRRLLLDPAAAEMAAAGAVRLVPHLLDALEAGRGGEAPAARLSRMLARMLGGGELAPVVARALRALVDGDRHQAVLSFLIDQIRALLRSREAHLHQLIEDRVREQGGRLVGWAIGGSVASRVLSAINVELDRTNPRESDLREAATAWIRREIDLIETDPARGREIADILRGILTHHSLRAWTADVWARLREAVEAELGHEEGWVRRLVADALAGAADMLERDQAVRTAVGRTASVLARRALPGLREYLSAFIARVVGGWDTARLVERVELRVGGDLQFVRINGTLVGCLVGVLLYLLLWALLGVRTG